MVSPGEQATPEGSSAVYDALAQKAASELGPREARESGWKRAGEWVVGTLALLALALCSYNIFMRYFFPPFALELSDEVQVYLSVWAVLLALGLVTVEDRHVKADLFVSMFPPVFRRRVEVFGELLGLCFSLLLLSYGIAIAWGSWSFGDLSTTSLRFPLWIYVAALPAGALSMAAGYAVRLADRFRQGN